MVERFWRLLLAGALLWLPALAAGHVSSLESHAHEAGYTYTAFSFGKRDVLALYTVPAELAKADRDDFSNAVLAGIAIDSEGAACEPTLLDTVNYSAIDAYQYELRYDCGGAIGDLTIDYALFRDVPFHINFVELRIGEALSFAELGSMSPPLEVPIEYILWEQQFELPTEPAPIEGKAPGLGDYFTMGFTHVLSGYDHIAFLLGLLLIVRRLRTLILLITSFTIAHSITLGLSGLDIATFPVTLTEAAIAATIIYIGIENLVYLFRDRGVHTIRRRWITTFIFGLIHGFGFSFLLREVGLPQEDFVAALLLFNVGVEAAQIAVVVVPFMLIKFFAERLPWWKHIAIGLSGAIAGLGAWWLAERLGLVTMLSAWL